jgi:hypothetical protein
MNDNFLVNHICITCDRIAYLTLVVFSHICYVSQSFCYGTLDYVRDMMKIHSGLVDILQPTKVILPVLDCSNSARIESDISYSLCLSPNLLPSCSTDLYFTYICKLSCILYTACNAHDPISVCSTYQRSIVEAWFSPLVNFYLADCFDLAYNKFDHRAFVRTLDLILHNNTIYIFHPRRAHDYMNFTYTCIFVYWAYSSYSQRWPTVLYIHILCIHVVLFFLPFSAYPKPRTAFLEEREDDEDIFME